MILSNEDKILRKKLKNSTIWIGDNPKKSEQLQKRLFSLGFYWSRNKTKVCHTYKTSIQIWNDNELTYGYGEKTYEDFSRKLKSSSKKEVKINI
jgi:hypothetical protein